MKTNIITYEIDENKFRNKIIDFERVTGQHAYIFMNQKTASVFEKQYKEAIVFKNGFYIEVYCGNKVFIDDDLEFGEIDIR